jgi:hypothetical protein
MTELIERQFSTITLISIALSQDFAICVGFNRLPVMMLMYAFGNVIDDNKFYNNRFYNFAVLKRYGLSRQVSSK